ncbi:MAG: DUF3160 domain-containing protein, partial [Calditrichaeota bacterium]
ALEDVDLYVTIAKSLLAGVQLPPQLTSTDKLDAVWNAVLSEKLVNLPLFMKTARPIDFSQFTVRGHYTIERPDGTRPLASYFRCMMWLGRIDFILANPPVEWELSREDVRRMNLGALLLNELISMNPANSEGSEIDEIITTLVGESDNLTPAELSDIEQSLNILNADALFDDPTFDAFQTALKASSASGQKILSLLIQGREEPGSDPVELPISFMLFGQRFIIDSYIFSSVVYDRIVYQGGKVCRLMPNPLDAMFALGNDDALPLLKNELDNYHYSSQLASLRYLIDAYDADFWGKSLYNAWLQSIRCLNPAAVQDGSPLFVHTTAWHQQKLNTQLASWTQLRHDNLLYAKQSYTGIPICSFPHSYVEPYPAFFHQIATFAEKADQIFYTITADENIKQYFTHLKEVMFKLEVIAQKEIDRQVLSSEEMQFLQDMLFVSSGPCGEPPFWGWYADLFYDPDKGGARVANEQDYLVADVHTQPADCAGIIVGRVFHVGVGKINLGVFLADSPSNDFKPMAYVGPVMSYYEKITSDFERLTDEQWEASVESGDVPARP